MPRSWLSLAFFVVLFAFIPLARAETVLLPTGPLPADGQASSTVHLWISDFQPTDKFKVRAEKGRVGEITAAPDGVLSFEVVPPRVTGPTTWVVELQRRGSVKTDEQVQFSLVPGFEGSLDVTFDPPRLLLGSGTALVRITPRSTTPQDAAARRILLSASTGTIEEPVPSGDGSWIARYTPPKEIPGARTILISAADRASPDTIWGWAALTLRVKQSVSVQVQPDANVLLSVADKTWGPLRASPAGTAAFDIEMDPANAKGRVQSVAPDGGRIELEVDLPRPEYDRLAFLPLPPSVPADPRVSLPVRVVTTELDGRPASIGPTLRVSRGVISAVSSTRESGVWEALYTPPLEPGEVSFYAEFNGGTATARTQLVAAMPRVDLTAEPTLLPKDKRDFTITARVKDSQGTGLPGRPPYLTVQGAAAVGKVVDNKDGTYTAKYRMGASDPKAMVSATPPLEASRLAVYRLLLWPVRSSAPADGTTRLPVTVVALDRYGLPVPNVEVTLAVPRGDASLPPTLKTDAQGVLRTEARLGQQTGVVWLRATAAGLVAEAPLFQHAPGQPLAPEFTEAGDRGRLEAMALWRAAVPAMTVTREGIAPRAGPPSVVTVTTVPPYTTPGCAVLVTVRVTDAAGNPVGQAKPKVTSSLGTVGAITDNGDGSYNLPVQLPPGQDGPITITATAGSVNASQTLQTFTSMVLAGATPTAGTVAMPMVTAAQTMPGTQPVPGAQKPASATRSRTRGERADFRMQAGLASMAHTYAMESTGEGAAPTHAEFTNGDFLSADIGGAPALGAFALLQPFEFPIAMEADVLGWFEGVEIANKVNYAKGVDWRVAVRYRADLLDSVYLFALLGAQHGTTMAFRYTDASRSAAEIVNHGITGAAIGGGAGFEKGRLWAELAGDATFAPLPNLYGFRLQVAWCLGEKAAACPFLQFAPQGRRVTFDLPDTEEQVTLKESVQPLMIGFGGAFR